MSDDFEREQPTEPLVELGSLNLGLIVDEAISRGFDINKLLFPFPDPTRLKFVNSMRNLEATSLDVREFTLQVLELSRPIEKVAMRERTKQHQTMLNAGKALFPKVSQDGEYEWLPIPKNSAEEFKTLLGTVTYEEVDPQKALAEETADFSDDAIFALGITLDPIVDELVAIGDRIPSRNEPGSVPEWVRLRSRVDPIADKIMHDIYLEHDHPELTGLIRKIRLFIQDIEELRADPAGNAAKRFIAIAEDTLKEDYAKRTDVAIAAGNEKLLALLKEQRQNDKQAILDRRNKKPNKTGAPTPARLAISQEVRLAVAETQVPKWEQAGAVKASFAWIEDGQHVVVDLAKFGANGRALYIARALSPKLQDIADKARAKSPTKSNELNQFDAISRIEAQRIYDGIMPYTANNIAVKTIGSARSEAYQGVPIWYSYSVRPNAPRLYFTLGKTSDYGIEIGEGQEDAQCMVIIAETDKQNQIEVLQTLTGQNRKTLKSLGSGSV